MAWVRLDDAFVDHPKFLQAGPLAGYMHICAIAWSNRNLTNGVIPYAQVERLVNWAGVAHDIWHDGAPACGRDADAMELATALVSAGLWHEGPTGYVIHDYHDYQPSSHEVRKARAKVKRDRAAAGRKGGNRAAANRQQAVQQNGSRTTAERQQTSKQNDSK